MLCNPTPNTLCDPTLTKLNQENESCITKHILLCDSAAHTGTPFSMPRSPSETNRVSGCHSSLVTTPSSRRVLDKPKIEVTKVQIHHIDKNGEHSYGERQLKSNQHMGTLHAFSNCVRKTFKHGLSPSEVDWVDPEGEPTKHGPNNTPNGCMLMEVYWGVILKLNYTSYGCMLMEVDWGGKLRVNSVVDCQAHEIHPSGHCISEVYWGGHDPSPNHVNEFLFSEVDWGTRDSSLFLFLVNIDYNAKPKESSIKELWGKLQQRTSSTPLIELWIDSLATDKLKMIFSAPHQLTLT